MISEPNPYHWHNSPGYWPYPWDNWPTKTPWDRQRGRDGNARSDEPASPGDFSATNDIDQISLAPTPNEDFEDLPFAHSVEGDPLSSLPSFPSNDEVGLTATDTVNVDWYENLFAEEPGENLDGNSFSIPDTEIWSEIQGDPVASADIDTLAAAMAEQDPLLSFNDLEATIF